MMQWKRRGCLRALGAAGVWSLGGAKPVWAAQDDHSEGDPLGSMQWPSLRDEIMGKGARMRFAPEVLVRGPQFADDAMNVPVLLDARALSAVGGGIERIEVAADRNPVRAILSFTPHQSLPVLAFRFKLEQASPLRVMVLTRDGQWHVGQTLIQASGGGCTVPGRSRADGSWERTLMQVQAKFFLNVLEGSRRLRLRVMHPMDTGLAAGIPPFFIERMALTDERGALCWELALHEPVSENPLLTFEMANATAQRWVLTGADNNGNRLHEVIG